MKVVELEWLAAGSCAAVDAFTLEGGAWQIVRFPAMFGLLHHPQRGPILFDTGYAPRFFEACARLPYRIYSWITPVQIEAGQSVVEQLKQRGIAAEDVKTVILSHFHADHMGGLRDFPKAEIVASAAAYADVHGKTGWAALRRAFLPDLLPPDFAGRARLVANFGPSTWAPFERGYDVFADGSCLLVELPGHAVGQLGMLVQTVRGPVLLAADACWQSRSFQENRDLHPLAHWLLTADRADFRASLSKLVEFHRRYPDIPIYPSHCPQVYRDVVLG